MWPQRSDEVPNIIQFSKLSHLFPALGGNIKLVFKAEDLKKHKTSKSFNQQRQIINHA
jgi:hypothetical protein